MKNINSLLKLDFYTMKGLHIRLFVMFIVSLIIGSFSGPNIVIIINLFGLIFVISGFYQVAHQSNFNKLYSILPVRKSEIIKGRYLFILSYLLLLSLIAFILFCILSYVMNKQGMLIQGITTLSLSIILTSLVISIQLPVYFKFEYTKASFLVIVPFLIIFALGNAAVAHLLKVEGFVDKVRNLITYFENNIFLLLISSIGICLCFMLLSCYVSILIVRKK